MLYFMILVVMSTVTTLWMCLVLNLLHISLLILIPYNCFPVGINPSIAISCLIAGVAVASIKIGFLLLLSLADSGMLMVV